MEAIRYKRKGVVTKHTDILEQTPKHSIAPGRPIRDSEVTALPIIKKNALVQIEFKTANLFITTTGQAMTNGAKGEIIKIRNINSDQIVRAVVEDEHTVSVKPLVQSTALGEELHASK